MHTLGLHHIAILTHRLETLEAFYTQTLGFPVTRRWDDAGIVFVDAGGVQLELTQFDVSDTHPGPHPLDGGVGLNHLALRVADVDAAFEELSRLGVTVLPAPSTYKGAYRIAFLADPDGNVLELLQEL